MAFPENPSRQSLIPSFLYSSSLTPARMVNSEQNLKPSMNNPSGPSDSHPTPPSTAGMRPNFVIPAPKESRIAMFSPGYYAACTAGGILSCGLTHMAVTPLDLVKCNMQVEWIYFSLFFFSFPFCTFIILRSFRADNCVFHLYYLKLPY